MSRSTQQKRKRRLSLIIISVLFAITMIGLNIGKTWVQIMEKDKEEKFLKEEISKLQDEEVYLRSEVEKLQDPDYVARYAREKYLYSKDGEFTIKIP